jgi:drug/metabolite transporter (DMT)-like permease|tara:strand:- start:2845 stop:3696 length:852 start_codon:yes stop_codon:yes gene_type:complete
VNQVLRAYLAITVLAVSWGTIPLIIRTSEINSISLVGIRTFIGSIFLGLILLKKDVRIKELIKPGLILGPLLAIHWVTMFESIELNSVAVGIGLVFSYPIFVIFIEYARGTKLQSYQILLILSGFLGLYLLLDLVDVKSITGIIYGLVSAVSLAFIITIGERYSSKLGGLKVAFSQLIVAAFILIKFTFDSWNWMISNILISLFLGLFLTALGLTTYWYVVKVIKPLAVSTITYLEPVTGVVLGALILNENLEIKQIIGFSIVLLVGVLQVYLDSKVNPSSTS